MISGDGVIHLFTQALDDIVIGRVRRREMQHEAPVGRFKIVLDHLRFVDDVVVQYQM